MGQALAPQKSVPPDLYDAVTSIAELIDEGLRLIKLTTPAENDIGWAHPDARIGDEVFLLKGCFMPPSRGAQLPSQMHIESLVMLTWRVSWIMRSGQNRVREVWQMLNFVDFDCGRALKLHILPFSRLYAKICFSRVLRHPQGVYKLFCTTKISFTLPPLSSETQPASEEPAHWHGYYYLAPYLIAVYPSSTHHPYP